jgi:galactokinase
MFSSPGRVNLIGEHTDYNEGFVLPASVDKAIYMAIHKNYLNKYRFFAYNLDEKYETDCRNIEKCDKQWSNYILGGIAQFVKDDKQPTGFDCVFGGDVPLGAGMSSSAALTCCAVYAVNYINSYEYTTQQLAKFA